MYLKKNRSKYCLPDSIKKAILGTVYLKEGETSPKISLPIYYIDSETPGPLSCTREKKRFSSDVFRFFNLIAYNNEFQLHKFHGERINISSTHIVYQQTKMKPEVN